MISQQFISLCVCVRVRALYMLASALQVVGNLLDMNLLDMLSHLFNACCAFTTSQCMLC